MLNRIRNLPPHPFGLAHLDRTSDMTYGSTVCHLGQSCANAWWDLIIGPVKDSCQITAAGIAEHANRDPQNVGRVRGVRARPTVMTILQHFVTVSSGSADQWGAVLRAEGAGGGAEE